MGLLVHPPPPPTPLIKYTTFLRNFKICSYLKQNAQQVAKSSSILNIFQYIFKLSCIGKKHLHQLMARALVTFCLHGVLRKSKSCMEPTHLQHTQQKLSNDTHHYKIHNEQITHKIIEVVLGIPGSESLL